MQVNGTLINYFFHCKTQLWLHANRLNLEDNSEDVRIGKVLHEIKEERNKNSEISIDNIKIDKLTDEYLIEYKKSDSDPEAVKWQVLLYLYKLKQKGVIKKGKIEYFEKKNKSTKSETLELDESNEEKLLKVLQEMEKIINLPKAPEPIFENKCKKCAYYEYCFI
ncbi:MAG: CRISPR-associated protein Cas4 [Arcobacteraceae bacterium]|jgi:CRISPR-associated exonuclease Cas4|nr:CRISPR-associated protein Cas4 [Arcobacteraceae bacterium]